MNIHILTIGFFVIIPLSEVAFAHPGGTDSSGGHRCWTDCGSFGLSSGQYHYDMPDGSILIEGGSNTDETPSSVSCDRHSYRTEDNFCVEYPDVRNDEKSSLEQGKCPKGQFSVGDECLRSAGACKKRHGPSVEYSNDGECWCRSGYTFNNGYCEFVNTARSGRDEDVNRAQRRLQESIRARTSDSITVNRVVDGDTLKIILNGQEETVRVIGIDTPETVDSRKPIECFGREASSKMNSLVEGKEVELQEDPAQERDKYDRLLRYVHMNGQDIGAKMIREGYAFSYKSFPHPRLEKYNRLEQEAREAARGLWSSCNEDDVRENAASANDSEKFSDITEVHPYMSAIRWGKTSRVLSGYPDGTFRPDKTVNRAEFLKIVLEGKGVDVTSATAPTGFTDVDENAWYAPYIRYAKASGIIEGYPDGSFRPSEPVNFAEALKMAYVALDVPSAETDGEWYERFLRHAKRNSVLFSNNVNVGTGMSRKDVVWIVYKMMNHKGEWQKFETVNHPQQATEQQSNSDTSAKPLDIGHITFSPYWTNWDADAEDDGFEISPYFKNVDGEQVYPNSRDWSATVRIYDAVVDYNTYNDFDAHRTDIVQEIRFTGNDVKYEGILETPYIRVGREKFSNLQPSDDWVVIEAEFSSPTYGTFAAQDEQTPSFRTR